MTMGALHAGHRSLLEAAAGEGLWTVATVFVNPTQFGPGEDFAKYPRTLDADLDVCRDAGAALVFTPSAEEMYPPDAGTVVRLPNITAPLEGRFRPGHFDGVATVVLKLLNVVQPDVAYFGRKDYQQAAVIRRMVRDLNVPTEVRVCETVREPGGLAMSSRNRYLSADERAAALSISEALNESATLLRTEGVSVDFVRAQMWALLSRSDLVAVQYASVADADSLEELHETRERMVVSVAAKVGETRLIDNVVVDLGGPDVPAIPEVLNREPTA